MKYKVAFFTEGNYEGKVPRNNPNMRTDLSWIVALDAVHYPLYRVCSDVEIGYYDIGIIIVPKKNPDLAFKAFAKIKRFCKKVAVMQEGPNWYWQDYSMANQVDYFALLQDVDFILCHNLSDKLYYEGLVGNEEKVYVMQTLIIEDALPSLEPLKKWRECVFIGGNMCSWYGGFDSMSIAAEFDCKMYAPSMGRKKPDEEKYTGMNYLPYMNWKEWIAELNKMKYAVHLMRTHAAGTFALNCCRLGIPCIGYKGLDTQQLCHPHTTVKLGDLSEARYIAKQLKEDDLFYESCSKQCRMNYDTYYTEGIFIKKMEKSFDSIFNSKEVSI